MNMIENDIDSPICAGPEKRRKKRARRAWLQERKDEFHFLKETDRPEVLYIVREDGIWEESRRSPTDLHDYRARRKIQQGKTKYKPSVHGEYSAQQPEEASACDLAPLSSPSCHQIV
jgi:hypothetical protein